jgi:uncharacterized protein YhaN
LWQRQPEVFAEVDFETERQLRKRLDAERALQEEDAARIARLERELQVERRERSDVEGEWRSVRERRREVVRQHDRLALLEQVVRRAAERFRARHAAAVTRRASEHLAKLTAGRHRRLVLAAGAEPAIGDAETGGSRGLTEGFSQGTVGQAQLALRLAFVERLDEERGETLPLWIDEALVQFDPIRLGQALELLAVAAEQRQVLVFTCHPWIAEAATRLGARSLCVDDAPSGARVWG